MKLPIAHNRTSEGVTVFLQIDPRTTPPGQIAVREPDDCTRLHIDGTGLDGAPLDDETIGDAIRRTGAGFAAGEPGRFRIRIDWLRRSAGAAGVADGWGDRFTAMLSQARSHGWLDDEDDTVGAHVREATPMPTDEH
jgi:hypothetical protein